MKAFTSITFMLTLSIFAILLYMLTPQYIYYLQAKKATAIANQLVSDLNDARVHALLDGEAVMICPILDKTAQYCSDNLNGSKGWILFKADNVSNTQPSKQVVYLRYYRNDLVRVLFDIQPRRIHHVTFNALGKLSTVPFRLTIKPIHCTGYAAQVITVSSSGFVSKEASSC